MFHGGHISTRYLYLYNLYFYIYTIYIYIYTYLYLYKAAAMKAYEHKVQTRIAETMSTCISLLHWLRKTSWQISKSNGKFDYHYLILNYDWVPKANEAKLLCKLTLYYADWDWPHMNRDGKVLQ